MNEVPESVLQECLDLLAHGNSIEQIMDQHPEQIAVLRPFLETAAQLTTLVPQPSLAAKKRSQKAFLAHAQKLKVAPVRPSAWYRLRQILLPIASLALILILFTVTAVSVSASAIPGDALYTVKRLVEDVRLSQARDPETAVALTIQFREERLREVQTLLRTRRSAQVTLEGEIEALQTEYWTVASIMVELEETTIIEGTPQIGELARVNGRTENGRFIAAKIEVLTGSPLVPPQEPTAEPISSPTLQPIAEPTETTVPTATPTAAPTDAPTVAATMTPTREATVITTVEPTTTPTVPATIAPTDEPTTVPTATSPPPPTATPSPVPTTPPSNDNDDDNDNNDNGDNSNDNDDNDNNDNGDNSNDNDDNDNDNSGSGNSGSGNNNNDNDNDDNDNDNGDD